MSAVYLELNYIQFSICLFAFQRRVSFAELKYLLQFFYLQYFCLLFSGKYYNYIRVFLLVVSPMF